MFSNDYRLVTSNTRTPPIELTINHNHKIPTIIGPGDGSKRLLACSVPNLQFDLLVLDVHIPRTKFNTDCCIMLIPEPLVGELQQKATFSDIFKIMIKDRNTCITNNDELK